MAVINEKQKQEVFDIIRQNTVSSYFDGEKFVELNGFLKELESYHKNSPQHDSDGFYGLVAQQLIEQYKKDSNFNQVNLITLSHIGLREIVQGVVRNEPYYIKKESRKPNLLKRLLSKKENNESSYSEDFWKQRAADKLKNLKEDFDFNGIYIKGDMSWIQVYEWARDTYEVISEAQHNMTLDKKAAGFSTISLIAGEPSVKSADKSYDRGTYTQKINTIALTHDNKENMKQCWQHEYTHALDANCAIKYNQENNTNLEDWISKTAINEALSGKSEQNGDLHDIANAMSMLFTGKDSQEMSKTYNEKLSLMVESSNDYLLEIIVPEINNPKVISTEKHNKLVEAIKNSNISYLLFVAIRDKKIDNQIFETIKPGIQTIQKVLGENDFFVENALKNLQKRSPAFIDFANSLADSYNYNGKDIFFETKVGMDSLWMDKRSSQDYYASGIEILARASEEIQRPLIISSDMKEEKDMQWEVKLNQSERLILLKGIRAMASRLGLLMQPEIKDVMCLNKVLNEEEASTYKEDNQKEFKAYSNAANNENKTSIISNIQKYRDNQNAGVCKIASCKN